MSKPVSVTVFAPAKVNLTLHVTGRRADGYHLLDSLVAFADVGDSLFVQVGNTISVTTEGPEAAAVPADMSNLVLRTASLFEEMPGASFLLTKRLPVSSGIGGGSADAAAAFRGLMTFWSGGEVAADMYAADRTPMADALLQLGADIPMCLMSQTARIEGVGERITPLPGIPLIDAVLVNPRKAVSTPAVFRAMRSRDNPPMPETLPQFAGYHDFVLWLEGQRNDLQAPAIELEPSIGNVLAALEGLASCRLARMSGSGATCFGLFANGAQAKEAADRLRASHPGWWVQPTRLGTQTERALPRVS